MVMLGYVTYVLVLVEDVERFNYAHRVLLLPVLLQIIAISIKLLS